MPGALDILGDSSYAIHLVRFSAITLQAIGFIRLVAVPANNEVYLAIAALGVAAGEAFDRAVYQPVLRRPRRRFDAGTFQRLMASIFQLLVFKTTALQAMISQLLTL